MNLLLIFSTNISLKDWDNSGIFSREVLIYKHLSDKEIQIKFLTYGDDTDLYYLNILKNIEIIPLKLSKHIPHLFFFKVFLYPLFHYRTFQNIDLIKTNQMDGSWITWLLRVIFQKKVILRCGYIPFKIYLEEYKKKSRNTLDYKLSLIKKYLLESISYKLSSHIILTNNFEKKFVINYFRIKPEKISILPNYIDTDLFQPIKTKKIENTVLFIGSLNKHKNLENLIKSFLYLEKYSLHIVGEGELKPNLIIKISKLNLQNRIKFLGTFPNLELPKLINQYKLFILPSNSEGNPKSLLEAMSCGIPCIGSNIMGIRQIITHKKNGYLCSLDSKAISYAIKSVFEDSQLREHLSNNAREYILNNNSIDLISQKELKVYKKVL